MSEKLKSFASSKKESLVNPWTEAVVKAVGSKAVEHLKTAGEVAGKVARNEKVQASAMRTGELALRAAKITNRKGNISQRGVEKAIADPRKALRKAGGAIAGELPGLRSVVSEARGDQPTSEETTRRGRARDRLSSIYGSVSDIAAQGKDRFASRTTTAATRPQERAPETPAPGSVEAFNAMYAAPDSAGNPGQPLPQDLAETFGPGPAGAQATPERPSVIGPRGNA